MAKKWNIVAVVMFLGSVAQANPGSQIATQVASQIAETAGREVMQGAGRELAQGVHALNGCFKPTRINRSKDLKNTLSDSSAAKLVVEETTTQVATDVEGSVSQKLVSEVNANNAAEEVAARQANWKDKGAATEVKPAAEATEATSAAEATETKQTKFQIIKEYATASVRIPANYVRGLFKSKSEKVSKANAEEAKPATEATEADQAKVHAENNADVLKKSFATRMKDALPNNPFAKKAGPVSNSYAQRAQEFVGNHKLATGVVGVGTVAAVAAGLYNWFETMAKDVVPAKDTLATEVSNSWFTKRNAIIATVGAVALTAGYQLWSMFTKPTFEELVIKYVEETTETNPQVVVEQFCAILQQYGYTSEADQQKAIEVLQAKGYVEA